MAGIVYATVAGSVVAVAVCLVLSAVVDRDTMAVLDFEVVVALFFLLSISFSHEALPLAWVARQGELEGMLV
jgi:hypothetical protein